MTSALSFLEGTPVQPWRWRAFVGSFVLFGLALFAVTWRLWTPQMLFPQVPLVAIAGELPRAVEWIAFAIALAALVVSAVPRCASASYVAFAAATTLLFFIDQHRLQPWAFQFVVLALVLAALPPPRAFVLLRWLVVSIYLWSAIAKCDATFIGTLGQQFLAALVGLAGLSTETWSPAAKNFGAWLFPLSELAVGIGLALPLARSRWLRRTVLALVIALHVGLLLVLSPLGLAHQPAVLVWNGWFMLQTILLFGFPIPDAKPACAPAARHWLGELSEVVVELLIALVIALPALNLADRYDHWLAWGLYAPRNSRVALSVARDRAATIDPRYAKYLALDDSGDWARWRLDAWSLDTLGVPIYPQDRFQLGVAAAAIESQHLDSDFQIIMQTTADRRTGRRDEQTISTLRQLDAAQSTFFWNARPRSGGFYPPQTQCKSRGGWKPPLRRCL